MSALRTKSDHLTLGQLKHVQQDESKNNISN